MDSPAINNPDVDRMVLKLPLKIILSHGGSESLVDKINALIYESAHIPHVQVTETLKKKRGRPAGSKNKQKEPVTATEVTKKRGRPAGSKNKQQVPATATEVTKKRGRPAGSKNKQKVPATATEVTKKRGRPAGSKNKQKVPATATEVTESPKECDHPTKQRSADKHTRKSKRSTSAATTIQRYARRYINEYHILSTVHTAQ